MSKGHSSSPKDNHSKQSTIITTIKEGKREEEVETLSLREVKGLNAPRNLATSTKESSSIVFGQIAKLIESIFEDDSSGNKRVTSPPLPPLTVA